MDIDSVYEKLGPLRENINRFLIGQPDVVDQVLISLFSCGHVLIEGVPGLGKTLLVRTLAACFGGNFKRIQFTPDLMPADITGHVMFDTKENKFHIRKGPVFTNLLLADEINRSPAKTQAALLEVMQERQVTIEGSAYAIPKPFMVLATQNPIEQEGTYPLPEAQLDRFLMKIFIDYPDYENELALTKSVTSNANDDLLQTQSPEVVLTSEDIVEIQNAVKDIIVDEKVMDYAVRIVRETRNTTSIIQGASPRASIGLIRCGRVNALLRKSDFIVPDDIKSVALPVLRHRVGLSADVEIDGYTADEVLRNLIDTVDAPRV